MPMQFSAHCLIWTDKWSDNAVGLIDRVASMGFDAIEITMRDLAAIDALVVKRRLDDAGIKAICVTGIPRNADLTSSDVDVRAEGIKILKATVEKAVNLGSDLVTGVTYAPWTKLVGRGPTGDELSWSAESLREVARYAQRFGVRLGIEPVNRYETYVLNTAAQARCFVDRIGEPNIGIHLDTFHMNIEEKSLPDAIRTAGEKLFHLHAIENDRGIPGTGHLDWDGVFNALAQVGYNGVAGIETFLVAVPHVAALTCIWRQLAPDGDTLAQNGLAFLKAKSRQHAL